MHQTFALVMSGILCTALGLQVRGESLAPVDQDVKSIPETELYSHPKEAPVVWRTQIGDMAGGLALAQGRVLAGSRLRGEKPTPKGAVIKDEGGAMVCLDRETGALQWQTVHAPVGLRFLDLGEALSAPCVSGPRTWYLTNRAELVCVDLAASDTAHGPAVLWTLDMARELGVFRRGHSDIASASSSPVELDHLVYCSTGEGLRLDGSPSTAPSFIAVDKDTGKIAWSSNAPAPNLLFAQWTSPVIARVKGRYQVIFPGSDDWLYGLDPLTGKELWKVDCLALSGIDRSSLAKSKQRGYPPKAPVFVGAPVVDGDTLFVGLADSYFGLGVDPPSPLLAISLEGQGDATAMAKRWSFQDPDFGSTHVAPAVADGIVYVIGNRSTLFALEEKTGRVLWQSRYDEDPPCHFAAPLVSHSRVFVMGISGDLFIYRAGSQKQCLAHWSFGEMARTGPVADEDSIYVPTNGYLWRVRLSGLP